MDDSAVLSLEAAADAISMPGIHLLLGYHPRANLELAVQACIGALKRGVKALVIDCDRTIALQTKGFRMGADEMARVLMSHPGDALALQSDVRAAASIDGAGFLLLNRASSLIESTELLSRFEEKKALWTSLFRELRSLSTQAPVVILEDARRYDEIEYKVHPALYYLSDTILDAVDEGKSVNQYRIVKKRLVGAHPG